VLVGGLAAVFTTVSLGGAQKLQRRDVEAADNPAFIPIFNRLSFFEPFEVDIGGILSLTFKLGAVSNIDLQGHCSVLEHRFHCEERKNIQYTDPMGGLHLRWLKRRIHPQSF